jgi:hypothetical protein
MIFRIERQPPRSPIHIIWGGIAVIAVVIAGLIKPYLGILPACAFHELTGLPCPTCGGTRSLVALSGLKLGASFNYNPMIMMGIVGLVLFSFAVLLGVIFKRRTVIVFSSFEKKTIRFAIFILIIANWAFLILQAR